MCGYFCIITSAEMTAKEALDLYKSRDASKSCLKRIRASLKPEPEMGKIAEMATGEGKTLVATPSCVPERLDR